MDTATEQFFREGVANYAEANATVAAFERAAKNKVAEIARRDGACLLKNGLKVDVEGNGFSNGDDGGRVAYAHFPGQCAGEDVVWEIGIWWADPSDSTEVVLYAECWKGPDNVVKGKGQWSVVPKDVPGTWNVYKGGLNLVLNPNDDVDAMFRRLLDEVAEQSAAAMKRRR